MYEGIFIRCSAEVYYFFAVQLHRWYSENKCKNWFLNSPYHTKPNHTIPYYSIQYLIEYHTCIVREEARKEDHRPQQRGTFTPTEESAQQKAHINHGQTEHLEVNKHVEFVAVLEHTVGRDDRDKHADEGHLQYSGDQPRQIVHRVRQTHHLHTCIVVLYCIVLYIIVVYSTQFGCCIVNVKM